MAEMLAFLMDATLAVWLEYEMVVKWESYLA